MALVSIQFSREMVVSLSQQMSSHILGQKYIYACCLVPSRAQPGFTGSQWIMLASQWALFSLVWCPYSIHRSTFNSVILSSGIDISDKMLVDKFQHEWHDIVVLLFFFVFYSVSKEVNLVIILVLLVSLLLDIHFSGFVRCFQIKWLTLNWFKGLCQSAEKLEGIRISRKLLRVR